MLLAAAALLPAQMRGPGGTAPDPEKFAQMRVERLAQLLSLTEAQKSQALRIFTDAQTAAERFRQEMQTARETLQSAVRANNVAAIERAARDIGAATAEITSIEARAEAAFYALLAPEQKEKYDALPGRGRFRSGMGPGMMQQGGPAWPDR
jgi:Spy/CpxP family protein refolding chaperone